MRTPEDAPTDPDQLIRFGTIAAVDLAAARCVVALDDDSRTAPVRWIEMRAGRTRTWSPPSMGEQVVVLCAGGEIGAAVAMRGLSSAAFPPAGNSLREVMIFEDGAEIAYDPQAHELEFYLPAGATASIVADGGIAITGDITLTGKLTASDDVFAGGISLKNHTHTRVKTGTDSSGAPQ